MTDTGVFRVEARSAKGLSSSMNGEPPNGDVDPKALVDDIKSPRGGDDILRAGRVILQIGTVQIASLQCR